MISTNFLLHDDAGECGLSDESGVCGRRAVFLSVHGRGGHSEGALNLGVFLGFVVPVTNSGVCVQN